MPPPLALCPKSAVFEFSSYAIHTIGLKFTIDIRPDLWYHFSCYLDETSPIPPAVPALTLAFSVACCLFVSLGSLFRTPLVSFQ